MPFQKYYLKSVLTFLKYYRVTNLILVVLVFYITRFFLMEPMLEDLDLEFHFNKRLFEYLLVSTLCITIGGFMINNYYDYEIDKINRPSRLIRVNPKTNLITYFIFTTIGLAIGIYISYSVDKLYMISVHVFSVCSLFFYSSYLKKKVVLFSNLLICLLCSLTVILPSIYELIVLQSQAIQTLTYINKLFPFINLEKLKADYEKRIYDEVFRLAYYAAFAFILTLAREIIKDITDVKGDKASGRKTIPILFGIKKTSNLVVILLIASFGLILSVDALYLYYGLFKSALLASFLIGIPTGFTIYTFIKKKYSLSEMLVKVIFFSALVFCVANHYV